VTLAGRLDGTLSGAPFTARAAGHRITLHLPLSLNAAKGLWRSRQSLNFARRRQLGIRISATLAGVPIGSIRV
jgi:hypothetical protein